MFMSPVDAVKATPLVPPDESEPTETAVAETVTLPSAVKLDVDV